MKVTPFENVKDQLGFCGIWCGSCPAGNSEIVELTRIYEEIVKKNKLEKWAPKDFDFNEFTKGLSSIQKMTICSGCHKGGGNPTCAVRICAQKRNILNCSQCDELSVCKNFKELEKSHPRIKEDLKQIKNVELKKLVEKWTGELKGKFPSCILFCHAVQQ
ncbi:MAG: DUF3795 domain-containing protein [Promethearchaeota archaeon]